MGIRRVNSGRSRLVFAGVVAALVELVPVDVAAHAVGLSSGQYVLTSGPDGATLSVDLVFARGEWVGLLEVSAAELAVADRAISDRFMKLLSVESERNPCVPKFLGTSLLEEDGVSIRSSFHCPTAGGQTGEATDQGTVKITTAFLGVLPAGHRHVVHASGGGSPLDLVLFRGRESFLVAASGSGATGSLAPGSASPTTFSDMFLVGVEHILFGFDHLAFLFGLILVGGSFRRLAAIITSFTLAHSITLGLAVLGVFSPPGAIIEPLIALSVAYVGVENLAVKEPKKRWLLTFAFGLIHGFGFAGALAQVGIPPDRIPSSLLAFNLGVEAGQLSVLAVVLPPVVLLRKKPTFAYAGVRALSAVLAAMGLWWFVDRVVPL